MRNFLSATARFAVYSFFGILLSVVILSMFGRTIDYFFPASADFMVIFVGLGIPAGLLFGWKQTFGRKIRSEISPAG